MWGHKASYCKLFKKKKMREEKNKERNNCCSARSMTMNTNGENGAVWAFGTAVRTPVGAAS